MSINWSNFHRKKELLVDMLGEMNIPLSLLLKNELRGNRVYVFSIS